MNNSLKEIIGQETAIELLQKAVALERLAPAYLFAGPPGVGKSMTARSFSQIILSLGRSPTRLNLIEKRLQTDNHPDLLWVEPTYIHQGKLLTRKQAKAVGLSRRAPPSIRIQQIREISQFLSRPPLEASRAVVVIEEAQTMAEAAANALLKTLEEPGKAVLILIAPNNNALLPTLVSRCQSIPFYRLSEENLDRVLIKAGYQKSWENATLLAIAQGSPGEAIAAYQQLQTIPEDLLAKLTELPGKPVQALALAQEIAAKLDLEAQLWLINYLQHYFWQKFSQQILIKELEKTKKYLLSYAQTRLVWECTLLNLFQQRR